jgi:glycosyltransferase involved in cell wall biosynthesis
MSETDHAPRTVLQVITDTDRRGAQVFALDLAVQLSRHGSDVRTVALSHGDDEVAFSVPAIGPRRLGIRTTMRLRSLAREADVVVAHGSKTLAACAVSLLGTRVPFVYRSIGEPSYWIRGPWHRRRTRLLLRRAAAVVALWEGAVDGLASLGVERDRIVVIPQGSDPQAYRPPDDDRRMRVRQRFGLDGEPVVLYLGALSKEKRVELAMRTVAGMDRGVLVVAGSGPEREHLEHVASEIAAGRVRFVGTVEDPRDVLHASDVLVLPSRTEGVPGCLVEAAMCGIPVVATDVGGVRGVVADGIGRVVPADDPAAFANAVRDVLAHPRRGSAPSVPERFDIRQIGDRWGQLLHEMARGTR